MDFAGNDANELITFDNLSCQDPQIPPDGAFLHSSNVSLRNPSWPAGQYALPHFPRENAFALDDGHTYPQDMPAPRVLPHTVDPSSLLPRHFSMSGIQDESVSGSENEKENEDELNSGWPHRLDGDTYDANGWLGDPGTIRLGVPGFGDTKPKADLRDAAGVQVPVEIHAGFVLKRKAAIQRYFTILYRRNYFSIQASFTFRPPLGSSSDETLYLYGESHRRERIQAIFMCMRGVVETEEGPEIKIVVFNAKRKPLYEGDNPPPIDPQRMKPLTDGSTKFYTKSTGDRHDHINVPMNHTFPRNQFRAATQNNGARRTEQQFYRILLELKAEILVNGSPRLSTIASKLSDSLVVRGRCPLSFKEKDDASGPDRIGGHTRDSDRKGRKPPRREGGKGSKEASTRQIQEEGSTIGASRGFCNGTGPSSRLSTRASTGLMNLTPGTRSWSCDTAPVSPLPTSRAHGTVNGQTIPSIGSNLLTLVQEDWQGDRPGG